MAKIYRTARDVFSKFCSDNSSASATRHDTELLDYSIRGICIYTYVSTVLSVKCVVFWIKASNFSRTMATKS